MTQSQNGSGSLSFTRQTNFRVMLLRANGEIALVYLCSNRRQALQIARNVCKKHLKRLKSNWQQIVRHPNRPKIVFLEAWHGTPTSGFWERLNAAVFDSSSTTEPEVVRRLTIRQLKSFGRQDRWFDVFC